MILDANEGPLLGPQADERGPKLTIEDVRLANGSPLYHALLDNPDTPTLSTSEAQKAKSRLSIIASIDQGRVFSCHGKTLPEAKAILETIESSQNREQVA